MNEDAWKFEIKPVDEHNQTLLGHVHPDDWTNPTPDGVYNLVVIGAGSAGLIASIGTAGLGGKVALIERHLMGGDCLNVGCVPSKSIIRPARLAHEMRTAEAFGLSPADISPADFPNVMERMRELRARFSAHDSPDRYTQEGVDVYIGEARFAGRSEIAVDGRRLRFKKAVIATGSHPVVPEIDGLKSAGYHTNETIFNLTKLPGHLIVIGGGPIGCELAQAFRRLGSEVTIILRSTFLSKEDPEAAERLAEVFEREGIRVLADAKVTRVSVEEGHRKVHVSQNGSTVTVEGDEILMGTGRAPTVEGLDLDVAQVAYDAKLGIHVDDRLRTSNKNIYAAGDCCMKHQFTHAADAAAQIVIQNALFGGRKKASDLVIPWCTYTDPEIAHVGLYEHEANEQGIETNIFRADLSRNGRAEMDGEDNGFVKVLTRKGSDKILGATVVAAHAGDLISEFTLAMTNGLGLGAFAGTIYPYPTQAEAIKAVATEWRKTKLTPTVARLLKGWLAFRR